MSISSNSKMKSNVTKTCLRSRQFCKCPEMFRYRTVLHYHWILSWDKTIHLTSTSISQIQFDIVIPIIRRPPSGPYFWTEPCNLILALLLHSRGHGATYAYRISISFSSLSACKWRDYTFQFIIHKSSYLSKLHNLDSCKRVLKQTKKQSSFEVFKTGSFCLLFPR
jgi:hypothetical protein